MPLSKRIIPCLDVKDGVVVKGICFKDLRSVGEPASLAVEYQEQGADDTLRHRAQNADVACATPRIPAMAAGAGGARAAAALEDPDPEEA